MGRTARGGGDQIGHGPLSRGFPALGATEILRLTETLQRDFSLNEKSKIFSSGLKAKQKESFWPALLFGDESS